MLTAAARGVDFSKIICSTCEGGSMGVSDRIHQMRLAFPSMAASSVQTRNEALANIAKALQENSEKIFAANALDMQAAREAGVAATVQKRLRYDEGKLAENLDQLSGLQKLPDPVGRTLLARELDEGLVLRRVTCPIGVIGVIFEARPDALVQISSLCIKSGNCAVLKGGRETMHTNAVLFSLIHQAATRAGLPSEALLQVESHSEIDELLGCDQDIDLLIPRGSNGFVRYIMDNTKIPVMGHSAGICHVYVDKAADQDMAVRVLVDAKTQYPAVCNAAETLLVDRAIAAEFLPKAARGLAEKGARLRGTQEVLDLLANVDGIPAPELMGDDEFGTEYGDLVMSCKVVDGVREAVEHINRWGSHHTDSIVTADDEAAETFMSLVDSAGVYRNCSTRFADGYRYGFGAEVGISTGKLHARGPVGLDGLVTYKYRLVGHGDVVADFAEGRRHFHFRDLED
ncbi:MAG: glutamate-5-semialdehyde dehydrogenase [Tractidigestivibacter sp.]|uniref:glutamate-5-semialdehyde dehydrogenase n=1 Tax=Tractidigestivibacter sp. TaxID=2847320 RepID=UPI003D909E6C